MLKFIQKILSAPVFEDVEKTRIAALLNSILWAVIVIGATYTLIAPSGSVLFCYPNWNHCPRRNYCTSTDDTRIRTRCSDHSFDRF
jgi:hypothetical protein